MAQKKASSGLTFTPVTTKKAVGEAVRNPAGGTIHPSGRLPLNLEGTKAFDQVARDSGVDPRDAGVWYGVIVDEKLVGVYPVPSTSKEAKAGARRDDGRKSVTLYLDSVFDEHATLRVETKRSISVGPDIDAKGRPCLVIALQSTLPKRKGTRKSSKQSNGKAGGGSSQPQAQSRPQDAPNEASGENK